MSDKIDHITKEAIKSARASLEQGNMAEAFSHLTLGVKIDARLAREAEALESRYFYMLRFLSSNHDIPDLKQILRDIYSELDHILSRLEMAVLADEDQGLLGSQLRYMALRPEETLESLISDYLAELEAVRTDTATLTDTTRRSGLERLASDIFMRIWAELPKIDDSVGLIESMLTDASVPVYDRVLWTSAVGLVNLQHFTVERARMLARVYGNADENQVAVAALVWNILTINYRACELESKEFNEVKADVFSEYDPADIAAVVTELARAPGTEDFAKYFKETIEPELRDLGRAMTEKFKDIDPEKADELMMDPEWLSSDMGAKGFDSLRNFTEAQKSGADVFMASLGKMRMFPFFNRMSNWLLPFHTANSALAPVVDGEGAAIADTVSRMPVICDSDKYALLLSMAATPEALRAKAFEAMTAQIFNASQTPEFQEVFSSGANRRALVTSYVHTLYRFFTQFHNGKEFPNPMATEPVIDLFAPFINFEDSKENLATVADILFSSKHYRAALEWYQELEESEKLDNARRRKMVFAAEMSAKYLAVEMYQALLEIDPGDLWAAMRLASCMLREGNDNGAYTVLEPFLPNNSDNIEFLRLMATTYMHAGKYEAALDTLHNLDYLLGEGDYSAKGDIAWATALCGNIPEAIEVYELADGTPLTQARRALVLWLGGQRPKSLEIMASLAGRGVDFDKIGLYDNGYQHLFVKAQGGLSLSQIPDALRYKIYGSKFGNLL